MIRALFYKELRDVGGWTVGIFAFQLSITLMLMGINVLPLVANGQRQSIPFLQDDAATVVYLGGIFMLLVAFRQTAWESSRDYFLFLLHRPVQRWVVLAAKLFSGAAAYALCVALPVVMLGVWAAAPGTHPSPFRWSMTSQTWCLAAAMMLPYFGAFLSGLRPARWLGTKLLPLLASIVCCVACLEPLISGYGLVSVCMSLACIACFVVSILHTVVTRDY